MSAIELDLPTPSTQSSIVTAGVDVGSSAVKVAVMTTTTATAEIITLHTERIRRRDLRKVISESYETALGEIGLSHDDVAYAATTGEGELAEFRRGHFYGMTTHSRGAIFLMPEVRAVLDVGALHARAMKIDDQSRVVNYKMTSQCASGSGQFLENVARYLGVSLEEIGELSKQASSPEVVSSICAVLAETDVINMVSRGIRPPDIVKGIHVSMAGRYAKLLRGVGADQTVALTGGLASDRGLADALRDKLLEDGLDVEVKTHPHSVYAGAIGAALWGAFRHRVLERRAASGH
jgi:benzoyl-CoA reductase subunit D